MQFAGISRLLAKRTLIGHNLATMARLRDVGPVLRDVGIWTLTRRIIEQIVEDNVTTLGAAMAYSWLFAVFPFLVFLLSLVPFLPERIKPNVRADVAQFVDGGVE